MPWLGVIERLIRPLMLALGLWRVRESGKESARAEAVEEVLDDASEIETARRDPDERERVSRHTGWD